jgi:hypothetical protein
MPHTDRPAAPRPALSLRLLIAFAGLGLALLAAPAAPAAEDEAATLRINGIHPGGLRIYVTDAWGSFDFDLTNLTDTDRQARVVVFYQQRPDEEYGRDVWVPARSTVRSWMLVGPAPAETPGSVCDIEFLLYDRTDGTDRLIRPRGEEHVRSRGVIYHKRDPVTAVLLDDGEPEELFGGQLPQPDSANDEALTLARVFREARGLSEMVRRLGPRSLPTTAEAFDGIDQFAIATGEVAKNPDAMRALRQWLEHGGKLWVMIDRVDPEVLAPLLGEALDFTLVDRVPLTSFSVEAATGPAGQFAPQRHDRPVTLARVLLPAEEHPRHTVNGWPIWFTRQIGRGKVMFTTLGPRGWYRPRNFSKEPKDPPSPFEHYPRVPVPLDTLLPVSEELQPSPEPDPFRAEALRPLLDPEIGYSVVRRGWVVLVFGGFLLAALALGFALRKSRRPELIGWLGPAAALGAAGVFLGLGEASRRAVPPTVAVVQVVEPVAGQDEADVQGLLAVYRPDSGRAEIGAAGGGYFKLDQGGLGGKARRFMLTDLDAWHWEDLDLPAGVRLAPFHYTVPTGEPIRAVGHFGPEGLEGRLTAGPFGELADALLNPANGRNLALRLEPDGTFRAGPGDVLPREQFLAGAVLSDRQQRRQEFYRGALKPPTAGRPEGPNTLMAWARPTDMRFTLASGARAAGDALLVVPLRLERSTPGERVTIPGPLVPYRRLLDGRSIRASFEGGQGTAMNLRFQLPAAVLPFQVDKARLLARVNAPGRRVTVAGVADGAASVLGEEESPLDPIRVEIADPRFLGLDAEGGLRLDLTISDTLGGEGKRGTSRSGEHWAIEYLELEVTGRSQ